MIRERDHHFDNIKAILIFCVVLGHVLKRFGMTQGAGLLYDIIFSFHMPAFLFVSGYFAGNHPQKVFARLFPLYVVFQFLQYLERGLLAAVGTGKVSFGRFDLFTPQWTLWYLLAMMMFQLLLPVFDTEDRKKQGIFLVVALGLGFLIGFTPDTNNFLSMSRVFVFLPFYLWGYYEKKNQLVLGFCRREHPWLSKGIAAAAGVLLIVIFCVFQNVISAQCFYGTESYTDAGMIVGRIFGWLTAFLWILILLIWVPDKDLGYMGVIGKNTLPVYLLHSLTILALLKTPIKGWMNGNLLCLILLSLLMTVVLSWNGFEKLLRKIKIP